MKKGQRLADVCNLLDLQPYVLRYWLTEFPTLRGDESASSGGRLFSEEEVAVLSRIKNLLYDEGYTIAGAKKKLESEPVEAHRTQGKGHRRTKKASALAVSDEAAEADDVAGDDDESAESLDTVEDEGIETLRRGVAAALEEARAILALLQARR